MRSLVLALGLVAACAGDVGVAGHYEAADQPDAWKACPFYVTTWTKLDLHDDRSFEAHSRTHYWAGTWFELDDAPGLVALEMGPSTAFETDDAFLQLADDGSLAGVVTQHYDGGTCQWRVQMGRY